MASTSIGTAAGFAAVPTGGERSTAVTYFKRNRPTPVSYQFTFDIENEVPRDLILEKVRPGTRQAVRPFPERSRWGAGLTLRPFKPRPVTHLGIRRVRYCVGRF